MGWMSALVLSVQPYLGVSDGELDWSIAADLSGTATPNILSELVFSEVRSYSGGLRGDLQLDLGWPQWGLVVAADLGYGRVTAGTSEDADYAGNNRRQLYSLSEADIAGDEQGYASLAAGLAYQWGKGRHQLQGLLGGVRWEQTLNLQRGEQLFVDPLYVNASLEQLNANLRNNLDSDYLSDWRFDSLAVNYHYQTPGWGLWSQVQYLTGDYYGEARWNLRTSGPAALQQPRSFSHYADANGWQLSGGVAWQLTERWSVQAAVHRVNWQTDSGVAYSYLADGDTNATRFNGAHWRSDRLEIGVEVRF